MIFMRNRTGTKAEWYGSKVVRVPTMYPSSQTCSCCGYKNPLVMNLAVRKWECPKCHAKHNRDTNASINILKVWAVLNSIINACGDYVKLKS